MRKGHIVIGIVFVWLMTNLSGVRALTGAEILRKVDENVKYNTIIYTGKMEIFINDDEAPRVKIMKVHGIGVEKAFVEFINPEDKNTRYLKIGKKMWIYDGEEENVFLISGHMLKQGIMGSDVSYEDALETDALYTKYDIEVVGTETLDGRACTVIELTAKVKEVSYDKRKMWVDSERFLAVKEEKYAKSGKLLKVSRVLEARQIGDRYFPVKSEVSDKLRKGSKTVFTMQEVRLDAPVSEKLFTMQNLQR
ncbi:MAG: outer membrane lipoprotein-sorting protein [Bacillota bacterium]